MTAAIACPTADQLKQFIDGTLPESEQATLTAHVETCETCQKAMENLVAGRETWEGAAKKLAEPPTAEPALKNVIDELRHDPHAATQVGATDELPLGFLSAPDDPAHLGKLHHYEIIETVGRGAFGIVLRAFDQKLHRIVAIKVMSPHFATNATARKRFIREGQAAAAVCHEHVVTIHAVEEASSLPYLVMQFISGKSLQERIDETGPLQVKEILRIGMQAADGLAAAHAQGLVHRDIKPANILLENGVERVKITDFGLARAVDDASLTQSGVIAGTPQYMAPEQARGESIDHRADLFSLGCVLYTMAAGRAPFRGSSTLAVMKRVCEDTPRPIREINPDIPDWLAAIIDKLMAKAPTNRFQTAREVADLLGQHLAHLQQPALAPKPTAIQPAPTALREDIARQVTTPAPAAVDSGIEAARRQVKGPAIALVVTGVLNWIGLIAAFSVFLYLASAQERGEWSDAVFYTMVFSLFGSWAILWGAFKMSRLESYGWAVASAVGALCVLPGYLVGWPAGLWALFVLRRPEVRAAFQRIRELAAIQPSPPESSGGAGQSATVDAEFDAGLAAIRRRVRGPAIGLVVIGLLNWLCLFIAAYGWLRLAAMAAEPSHADWGVALPLIFVGAWLILWSAFRMMRLEDYGWAVAGAIGSLLIGPAYGAVDSLVVGPACLVGIPVGVWSLIVLTRPEVRVAFRHVREQRSRTGGRQAVAPSQEKNLFGWEAFTFGPRFALGGVLVVVAVSTAIWFLNLNRPLISPGYQPVAPVPNAHLTVELADPAMPLDIWLWSKKYGDKESAGRQLPMTPGKRIVFEEAAPIGDYRVIATIDGRVWFNSRFYLEPNGRKTIVIPGGSKDYERLKGRWLVSLHEANGVRVPNEIRVLKLIFDGKSIAQITADDLHPRPQPTQFVVDDRQRPSHFDTYNDDGKHIETGIYEYQSDGDFLKLCKGPASGPRPTEFKTTPKSDYVLFVCTREGPPPTKPDEELLQGRWTALSGDMNGQPMPEDMLKEFWVEFTGETMHVPTQPGKVGKGTFTLNTAKSPREIVVIRESENNRGTRGIYELKDGTLRLCMGEPEDWPISEFRSRPGTKIINVVLKRSPPQATAEDEKPATTPEGKSPAPKVAPNDVEGLQRLVTLAQEDYDRLRMLVGRGVVSQTDLMDAEIKLKNAQLRLAVAQKDDPAIIRLLKELVKLRELDLDRMKKLQVRGVVPQAEVNDSERALIEAQLRLKQAEPASEPE